MIGLLVIIVLALLLGTGLALGLQYDLGYIRVSFGNYLVETNFWVGLALLVALVVLSVMLIGLVRRLRNGTSVMSGWIA
ncbi:MAG TPA: heme biosynthesis protein HemY, partial [Marinobacter sp.]|nr:heme biosynthesis protein HemY [Marinobacter sp.]